MTKGVNGHKGVKGRNGTKCQTGVEIQNGVKSQISRVYTNISTDILTSNSQGDLLLDQHHT